MRLQRMSAPWAKQWSDYPQVRELTLPVMMLQDLPSQVE
jgi:hypothetical protein